MAHAQRRPSSPLRSEAPDRAKNQEKYPRRSGRNTRSAAASGSPFLPGNALEGSEHHKQANMEGTVPTEATGDKNGRGVELANQTGVGKPSSKVLEPRRCDLGTIIDKDTESPHKGKITYEARQGQKRGNEGTRNCQSGS